MLGLMELDLDALFQPGRAETSGWRRMPAIGAEAMVATSHPLATRAGLRALERGGNAVDAALAAAAVLTVAEPTDNGVGGDAFALVWHDGGLTASTARAGRRPTCGGRSSRSGPRSVTVPGAVGSGPTCRALRPPRPRPGGRPGRRRGRARGLLLGAGRRQVGAGRQRAPWAPPARAALQAAGPRRTLRRIADGGAGPLRGRRRRGDRGGTWLAEDDLRAHASEWVEPLRAELPRRRGVRAAAERPGRCGAACPGALRRSRAEGRTSRSRR